MTRRSLIGVAAACGLALLAAIAPAALAAAPDVTAHYRTSAPSAQVYQAEPWLRLVNTGAGSQSLADLTIRYYFTADAAGARYRFACSWAVPGCANLTGVFHGDGLDRYLEIGFTAGAGSLAPGADTGHMQLRFYRSDWARMNQADDYSFGAGVTSYRAWERVTVHRGGELVWGSPPSGTPDPTPTPTPTDPPTDPPGDGPALFDDLDYTGHGDPRISQRGWTVRSGGGGPGVPGATWDPSKVTFAGGIMNLESSSDGTAAGTTQTEFYTRAMKFKEGTYAARVRFSDAPKGGGPDGDHMVQTFFSINDLTAPMAKDYSEYDFEYLPNGGWGEPSNILYATSWDTYRPDPWEAVNEHTEVRASYAGWHDLVFTIGAGCVTYYVDGSRFARHCQYPPERPMSINFNHWFIDLNGAGSGFRAYDQKVDYVFHAKDRVLTPAQVRAAVDAYRAAGVSFEDTVPG